MSEVRTFAKSGLDTYTAILKEVDKVAAKQRREEDDRKREQLTLPDISDNPPVVHECSCIDLIEHVETESVDVVNTDPPYSAEFIDCWRDLFVFASHALKPGGQLVALSGQSWLDRIFAFTMDDDIRLSYRWTMAFLIHGARTGVLGRKVANNAWKPVLVYTKEGGSPPCSISDVAHSEKRSARDDRFHEWQQTVVGQQVILRQFIHEPGMTVCDPFMGSGTTALAARTLKADFIVCDIDLTAWRERNDTWAEYGEAA